MTKPLIYLAGPYTAAPDRYYTLHLEYAAALIKAERAVYAPIVQCHALAETHNLPKDFAFWKAHNHRMLDHCDVLYVMEVDGWKESVGVQEEINYMRKHDKERMLVRLNGSIVIGKLGMI